MATAKKDLKVRKKRRSAVDVSKELIIDSIMLTSDVLHSIRNNLPVPIEDVIMERVREEEHSSWFSGYRGLLLAILAVVLLFGSVPLALDVLGGKSSGSEGDPGMVFGADDTRVADPETQLQIAADMLAGGDAVSALPILTGQWRTGERNARLGALYSEALTESGDPMRARDVAVTALGMHPGDEALRDAFNRAVAATTSLREGVELRAPTFQGLQALDDDPVTFRVTDGESRYIFRPAQEGHETDWANEVAATRLCAVVGCSFRVPESRVATVQRGEFQALYNAVDSPRQIAFREQLGRLAWDGDTLRGSLTEVVDQTAAFPLEHTRVWRNWLSAKLDTTYLEEAPTEALAAMKELEGDYYRRVLAHGGDATTRDVARQLSSMLAFDYLTNNWTRFARDEEDYGRNARVAAGQLVSPRNVTTFRSRSSKRVKGRFHWVTRFDQDMTSAVSALDREQASDALFGGLPISEMQQKVFWNQQSSFAKRIERLRERHGNSMWL